MPGTTNDTPPKGRLTMPDQRQLITDERRLTRFAIGCSIAAVAVSVAFASCTTPNPNYRRPKSSDAAETITLGSLSVSPGSLAPAFGPGTMTYSVDVASMESSVAVTATPQDSNATMTVNGQETGSGQECTIALNGAGFSTPISIIVMASDGSQNTYIVTVNRAALGSNNTLQSLIVSPGSLAPAFDASRMTYSLDVASTASNVAVTPTFQDSNASMTVNGQETSSGQTRTSSLKGPGFSTPISIVVTAANGSRNTYLVTVNRATLSGNNKLQSLSLSQAGFDSPFDPNTSTYTVQIGAGIESITVTAQAQDSGATVIINNQTTTSLSVQLAPTETTIVINVKAPNGNGNTYILNIRRGGH